MKQLKRIGMNSTGLLTFFKANLKPEKDETELECLQKTATRTIFIDIECYEERMSQLHLPTVNSFLFSTDENKFSKIFEDPSHHLLSRIRVNTFKTSHIAKYTCHACIHHEHLKRGLLFCL